jgi:E3 ubiquitin-protein ligase SHPRH
MSLVWTAMKKSKKSKSVTEHLWNCLKFYDRIDPTSRLGVFRMRLRGALEIEHMAIFFRANAYFQIKSNEDMTKPDTPEFQALEKLETEGYEEAKKLRREILQEVSK